MALLCPAFPQCQLFLSSKSTWFKILDPRAPRESLLRWTQGPGLLFGKFHVQPGVSSFFLQVSPLPLHARPTAALTSGWATPPDQEHPRHTTPPQGLCPTPLKSTRLSPSSALAKRPSWPCFAMCVLLWVRASWRHWPAGHVPLCFINQKCQNVFHTHVST